MENLIVILIVGFTAFYLGRTFYKNFKKGGGCGCGCSASCNTGAACSEPVEDKSDSL